MAPIAITALYDSTTQSLNVSLICDYFKVDTTGLKVILNIYKWTELFPKQTIQWPATLVRTKIVFLIKIDTLKIYIFPETQWRSL